ncbi:MAG: hypothetical protein IKO72_08980 [Kiritimatiellae bacterium]|nr:hypothetical protein [Kiritimatiellia bacterium]
MTQEQKDVVEEAADTVHRAFDTLEKAELELRNLGNIKVDESDPYSTRTDQIADKIYEAREALDLALELSRNFTNADVKA